MPKKNVDLVKCLRRSQRIAAAARSRNGGDRRQKKHLAARNENGADCFDALFAKMKVYIWHSKIFLKKNLRTKLSLTTNTNVKSKS